MRKHLHLAAMEYRGNQLYEARDSLKDSIKKASRRKQPKQQESSQAKEMTRKAAGFFLTGLAYLLGVAAICALLFLVLF